MDFTGTWQVVSSPDFDYDYLCMETTPYITLRQTRDHFDGEYQVGLQTGSIDGRLQSENQMVFSFEGMDEMDPVSGAGIATIEGDRLTFTLMYHLGDDFTFECQRRR
jgi:hypothetical protein